jgi:hypothetical protein
MNQKKFDYIIKLSIHVQIYVRLFHWNTKSYAQHISSGNLYSVLDDQIDKFVEVYMGKRDKNPPKSLVFDELKALDKNGIITVLNEYKTELTSFEYKDEDMTNTDLENIRDEIIAEINRTIYLLNLN